MAKRSAKGGMPAGYALIPISKLHLDLENPRHKPVQTEAAAIESLCDSELISELAQDIAERGALSPIDLMGVTPMKGLPGHFVSLEGNRRTCALIVAADPARAPVGVRPQLVRAAKNAGMPSEVFAYVFNDRKAAKQWIELRHLGQQGGAGVKSWTAEQQTRAAGDNSRTSARANTLAVAVLDRLLARAMITPEQQGQAKISTLTRYLGTPGVRAILGLQDATDLVYTHAADEVDGALRQLVLDSITAGDDGRRAVHSRSSTADRLDYANSLKSRGIAPTTHLDQAKRPPKPTRVAASKVGGAKSRSANHPDKRDRLFLSDFTVAVNDNVLLRLRGEALDLSVSKYPFSANYLLRALIEQVMVLFLKKRGKWNPKMSDEALSQHCAAELAAIGVSGKALSVVNKAAGDADNAYSLHTLGHGVHGGSIPTDTNVKRVFDTWRPALEAMLEHVVARTQKP